MRGYKFCFLFSSLFVSHPLFTFLPSPLVFRLGYIHGYRSTFLWFLGQSKNAVVLKIRERSGKEEEEKTKAVPVILLDRGQWSHLDAGCKTTWGLPVVVVGLISTVNSGDSTRGWKRRFHHRQRRIVQPLPLPPPHVAEPLPDKVRCNDSIIIWELIIFSKYRSYFDIFRLLENDFDYWIC